MEYKWFMVMIGFNYYAASAGSVDDSDAIQQRGTIMGYYSSLEEASSHIQETPDRAFPYLFKDYDNSRECDWYEIINLKDGVC